MKQGKLRFWVWINGSPVRLALAPDQLLRHHKFYPTDEGWNAVEESWQNNCDGDCIAYSYERRGRDCDGPYEHGRGWLCCAEGLSAGDIDDDCYDHNGERIRYPDWQIEGEYNRDLYAEMAGY